METKLEETNLETGWKRNRFYEGKSGNGKFRFSFPAYIRILGNEAAAQTANELPSDRLRLHNVGKRVHHAERAFNGTQSHPEQWPA